MVLYGASLSGYARIAHYGSADGVDNFSDSFAVVAIICVMALIEIFICIMGVMASNERNSTYMQVQYVDLCVGVGVCICVSFIVFIPVYFCCAFFFVVIIL